MATTIIIITITKPLIFFHFCYTYIYQSFHHLISLFLEMNKYLKIITINAILIANNIDLIIFKIGCQYCI